MQEKISGIENIIQKIVKRSACVTLGFALFSGLLLSISETALLSKEGFFLGIIAAFGILVGVQILDEYLKSAARKTFQQRILRCWLMEEEINARLKEVECSKGVSSLSSILTDGKLRALESLLMARLSGMRAVPEETKEIGTMIVRGELHMQAYMKKIRKKGVYRKNWCALYEELADKTAELLPA